MTSVRDAGHRQKICDCPGCFEKVDTYARCQPCTVGLVTSLQTSGRRFSVCILDTFKIGRGGLNNFGKFRKNFLSLIPK